MPGLDPLLFDKKRIILVLDFVKDTLQLGLSFKRYDDKEVTRSVFEWERGLPGLLNVWLIGDGTSKGLSGTVS
jgi:hypothetical protein